jgi:adenylate kinase
MRTNKHREMIVFLGKPGSGKGTQAEPLGKVLGIPAISVGDILRAEIKSKTAIGKKIAATVAAGKLIPVRIWTELMRRRLAKSDVKAGVILDGSPRDLDQARILDRIGPVTHAILVSITDREVVRRLSGRRVCPVCRNNYHVSLLKPKRPGICDECGNRLVQRYDDKPEVVAERLKSYEEDTVPVLKFYRGKRTLRRVDGVGPVGEINRRIAAAIRHADKL